MSTCTFQIDTLLSDRTLSIDVSGIRRVFELGASLKDPINLSIGQPDFPVPDAIKSATIDAINNDVNGYSLTQGLPALREVIKKRLTDEVGWDFEGGDVDAMVTSGTSGALLLAFMAMINPGDEAIIPDPYFVIYPALGPITGAKIVACDTYPDFRMTAERVEPLLTDRTKIVLINSPSNPVGTVLTSDELRELVELCEPRGVLVISDEIYDQFTFADALEDGRFPTPARFTDRMLLIRGYGKTYGCTGWRMGYAAGPTALMQQMAKLQQYTFVCAPSMAQAGVMGAFDVDMAPQVLAYQHRRDRVLKALGGVTEVPHPGGAFYVFAPVPERLGMTGSAFVERLIERNVLAIPGAVFSAKDTHFRLSYAVADDALDRGLEILSVELAGGGGS